MRLTQRSPVDKFRVGDEPVQNVIWGLDGRYSSEQPLADPPRRPPSARADARALAPAGAGRVCPAAPRQPADRRLPAAALPAAGQGPRLLRRRAARRLLHRRLRVVRERVLAQDARRVDPRLGARLDPGRGLRGPLDLLVLRLAAHHVPRRPRLVLAHARSVRPQASTDPAVRFLNITDVYDVDRSGLDPSQQQADDLRRLLLPVLPRAVQLQPQPARLLRQPEARLGRHGDPRARHVHRLRAQERRVPGVRRAPGLAKPRPTATPATTPTCSSTSGASPKTSSPTGATTRRTACRSKPSTRPRRRRGAARRAAPPTARSRSTRSRAHRRPRPRRPRLLRHGAPTTRPFWSPPSSRGFLTALPEAASGDPLLDAEVARSQADPSGDDYHHYLDNNYFGNAKTRSPFFPAGRPNAGAVPALLPGERAQLVRGPEQARQAVVHPARQLDAPGHRGPQRKRQHEPRERLPPVPHPALARRAAHALGAGGGERLCGRRDQGRLRLLPRAHPRAPAHALRRRDLHGQRDPVVSLQRRVHPGVDDRPQRARDHALCRLRPRVEPVAEVHPPRPPSASPPTPSPPTRASRSPRTTPRRTRHFTPRPKAR